MSELNLKFNLRAGLVVSVVLLVGTFLAAPSRVVAQGTTATILGTVTDSSGAAVGGATVQVSNTGTGIAQSVTTDTQGRYSVTNLEIGDYEVQVSKAGFATLVRKGITLSVGSQSVVDSSLTVGAQTQTVTVESQAVQVETTNSTLTQLIDPKQIRDLPLNGRDFEQLIQLSPGITTINASTVTARQGNSTQASYSGPGARAYGAAILLDDENMISWYGRGMASISGSSLGIDSMAEFTVLTNTYGAQFGGNLLVVNAVSRSGTNGFHGSVYGFFRNSALDARNFFDGATVPPFHRNQYGASIGGPIKKDKLFFFANYEGLQLALGKTSIATVPDANHRTPAASVTDPAERAAIVNVMALYPLPTFNFNPANGNGQADEVATENGAENYGLMRVDYQISSQDSIFARYVVDRQWQTNPFSSSAIPLWPEEDIGSSDYFTTEWKRIISNNIINTARFSVSRPSGVTTELQPGVTATPALQFIPGRQLGVLSITGLTGVGLGTDIAPQKQYQTKFAGGEDLLWTRGAHTFRFGGSVTRVQSNSVYPHVGGGSWTFTSLSNFLAGNANKLTGVSLSPLNSPTWQFRDIEAAVYVQDDWKVTPRLTLNLGIRYEPQSNPVDAHNQLYAFTNYLTGTGYAHVPHITLTNPNWRNIDPRIGFAYDLFGDHKTSLRGGFTLEHQPFIAGDYNSGFNSATPWQLSEVDASVAPVPFPSSITAIELGTSQALPSASTGWYYYNNKDPYMMAYNLNVQRELYGAVLSVGYVGSSGVNLETTLQQNPYTLTSGSSPGAPQFASLQTVNGKLTLVDNPLVNPLLGSTPAGVTIGNSHYNSLQTTLNRRFGGIVQAQVAYTYSHCIDDGSLNVGPLNPAGSGTIQNPYDFRASYGSCETDIRQSVRINAIVALPFKGNRFVQGWQLAGIGNIQSGIPFNPSDGYDVACNSTCAPRPNLVPNCNVYAGQSVSRWFNPACFALEAPGTLGNLGRNILTGPNLRQMDMSLTKETKINESYRIQLRWEVFNILNRPNFSLPATTLFSAGATAGTGVLTSTVGQITSTIPSSTSRQMQAGVKFIF